jgi:perosamine synthetase
LALRALDLPAGSEVVMPTFTIISCALACIYNNLKPVLVDCEPDTWSMDVSQIEEKITNKTKAIMVVHIYGHPVDMNSAIEIAKKYNLYIIQDAAEAIGAEYKGRKCGSFGDVNCFSFYANRTITTGEGGMVLTDDDKLAEKLKRLRSLGFIPQRRFYHEELGYNFRMTNIQAAIGLAQLERIEEHVNIKRKIGKLYTELLRDVPYLQLPLEKEWAKNIYWMYGIVLDEKTAIDSEEFAKKLLKNGIQTRPFFLGMHEQSVFHKMGLFNDEHYPVAERIARQGLYLPTGLTLTEDQIQEVCQKVHAVFNERH